LVTLLLFGDSVSTKDFYVYAHRRKTDGAVFYIGKGHEARAYSEKGRNKYWHKIVGKHGFAVELVVSGVQEWYALEREIELIAKLRERGYTLANVTDGGDGVSGLKFTEESRKRMSETHKTRHATNPDLAHALSARMRSMSLEQKDEMQRRASIANQSASVKKKHSENSLEMWGDPEFRQKHASAMTLVRANPEHVKNHREATRAAKMRPEERRRQSEMMTRVMSDPAKRAAVSESVRVAYLSDELRRRHKEATAKAFERPEVIANYRAAMASPKVRAKMSASQERRLVPVSCVESGAVFRSALDAGQWLKEGGFSAAQHNAVRGACSGKRKTAYGLHWTYAEKQRS
jgi:hypothetical protein